MVRDACRYALLQLMEKSTDPREPHECQAWELPTIFNQIVQDAAFIGCDDKIGRQFLESSLQVIWTRGHLLVLPNVEPTLEDVYGENADLAFHQQVFLPMVNYSAMMALVEPIPSDAPEFEDTHAAARWKIDEVFKRKGVHTNNALEKGSSQLLWTTLKDFQFGPGRPAASVLEKDPSKVTEEDAIDAFCPYLNDVEGITKRQADSSGEDQQGDDDDDNGDSGPGEDNDDAGAEDTPDEGDGGASGGGGENTDAAEGNGEGDGAESNADEEFLTNDNKLLESKAVVLLRCVSAWSRRTQEECCSRVGRRGQTLQGRTYLTGEKEFH